jgi:hypothetical protein
LEEELPGSRTTEQLRRAIDSGQTADKVDFPDPAAAPLGTDSEAGGDAPQAEAMSPSPPAEVVRKSTTHWTSGPIIYISILMLMIAAALALLWQSR